MSIDNSVEARGTDERLDERRLTLSQRGLYIARDVLPGQLDAAVEAANKLPHVRLRKEFHVRLMDRQDVKRQRAIGHVTVGSAEDKIEQVVPAFQHTMTAEVDDVGLIPRRNDEGSIIIVDFYTDIQEQIIDDRDDIIDVLEGFAPKADYDWKDFNRPGMAVGFVRAHNTGQERRTAQAAIANNIPRFLEFTFAQFDL